VFLLNSCLDQFNVAPAEPGHPLSRSYGVRLPSSLTRDYSNTLGLLSQSTRVGLRYGHFYFINNETFLDGMGSTKLPRVSPQLLPIISYDIRSGFPCPGIALRWRTHHVRWVCLTYPPVSSLCLHRNGTGIITRCPSPTPLGLGLGPTNPMRINLA
jgi:hypothetical protein